MVAPPPSVTLPVAGPADRVHFLDEQRRHRRASWRFSLLAVVAVVITGIPACVVVTPLLFAVVLTVGYIVNAVTPISPETWERPEQVAYAIPLLVEAMETGAAQREWARFAAGSALLVLPGAHSLFVLWLGVRGLLGRVAVAEA